MEGTQLSNSGMHLKQLELSGFKSFAKKTTLEFSASITAIVGPNGSGKSNIAESFRFVLGEQSMKSLRGKKGEDLIFSGTGAHARSNRASVRIVFDNSRRFLNIDFDEVSIERVVHRDGINEYKINDSQVRLRDVIELLASANVGSSGHHIVSQGEADRILVASTRERREMIEDALGLKIYQFKKQESKRKLFKTQENIVQVEALRKEVEPHLNFLKRQTEKLEKAREMRTKLKDLYKEYLKRETEYIKYQSESINSERRDPQAKLSKLNGELDEAKSFLEKSKGKDGKSAEVLSLEKRLRSAREEKEVASRTLGRLEGQIVASERQIEHAKERGSGDDAMSIQVGEVKRIVERVEELASDARKEDSADSLRGVIKSILQLMRDFIAKKSFEGSENPLAKDMAVLVRLKNEKKEFDRKLDSFVEAEGQLNDQYDLLKGEIEEVKDKSREAERRVFEIMSQQSELRVLLSSFDSREALLDRRRDDFKRELVEGVTLAGREILSYVDYEVRGSDGKDLSIADIVSEDQSVQEGRRREVEKIKIRLEEYGGGSADEIMKEYKEVSERDEFLAREISDLHKSADALNLLIMELEGKLDTQFKQGVAKINKEFSRFFTLMFDGGSAELTIVRERFRQRPVDPDNLIVGEDDETTKEIEEGIDINVSLPSKRIKGLTMLSGGERALTSIALIFAMSQVNPPPFLVLDETDAALDEANSRRYGDMIENLSQKSQLVLITHNRETMSRAGVLYGVTMGSDGISKLLSVKFEEATVSAT